MSALLLMSRLLIFLELSFLLNFFFSKGINIHCGKLESQKIKVLG